MKSKRFKLVVIGGGTGTFTLLKGLRDYPTLDLSAIVTMADDGGSNKVLIDQFGLLPTSGIRQCIVALSEQENLLRDLFTYRYHQGTGIAGMTFGNLFMAAVSDLVQSQRQAIVDTCHLLNVRGRILPVSYQQATLHATYEDGSEVIGEHAIDEPIASLAKLKITQLKTIPKVSLDVEAQQAILEADMIILGPGDLYTNTIANLVVSGTRQAIEKSSAKLVFITNLMTKLGETYNYQVSDYLNDLAQYLDPDRLNYIVINSDIIKQVSILKNYQTEQAKPVINDIGKTWYQAQVITQPLVSKLIATPQKGDKLARSIVRHDSKLLAKVIMRLLQFN